MNKDIFDMFDDFELEPEEEAGYRVSSEAVARRTLAKLHGERRGAPRRSRLLRTALIAAVIACFLSVTAYAAYYAMHLRVEDRTYTCQFWDGEDWLERSYTVKDSNVLSFDAPPKGWEYAFKPGWLPAPFTNHLTLYARFQELARTPEEMEALLTAEGLTEEESQTWYVVKMDADEDGYRDIGDRAPFYDIPYQILIYSDLYRREFVIGDRFDTAGDVKVEVLKDETAGDWHEIWVHVDETGADYAARMLEDPLLDTNIVLRFNRAEGYLVFLGGTLDCQTLHKIGENLTVRRTAIELEIPEDRPVETGLLNVARG